MTHISEFRRPRLGRFILYCLVQMNEFGVCLNEKLPGVAEEDYGGALDEAACNRIPQFLTGKFQTRVVSAAFPLANATRCHNHA